MNAQEYAKYEDEALAALDGIQERIIETVLFREWNIDLDRNKLHLLHDAERYLAADCALIGSWGGGEPARWRWGWANPSLQPPARSASESLRGLHAITGNPEFDSEEFLSIDERRAWAFAVIACRHLNGLGVYTLAERGVRWFFVLFTLELLVPEEKLHELAQHRAIDYLLSHTDDAAPVQWSGVDLRNVPEVPDTLLPEPAPRASPTVRLINLVRKRFPSVVFHLGDLDLRGKRLPWAGDLHVQEVIDWGYLGDRVVRDLDGINLSHSRLDGAILRGVRLAGASFEGSSLVGADLSGADLRGADLRNTFLNGANFTRARLSGADLSGAELSRTALNFVDLSAVRGLEDVRHISPSEVSFSTLMASKFKVTPTFLRSAGVSHGLLQDLARGQRFPHRYQTCFLSYSSVDVEFAQKLYDSLKRVKVRVFWDRFDVIPGEYLERQIAEAIADHDRLIVVLSEHSLASEWVKREIVMAWKAKRDSLLPIRLCPIEDVQAWTKQDTRLPDLAGTFPIQDFSGWKQAAEYRRCFGLLRNSLSGGVDVRPRKRPRA